MNLWYFFIVTEQNKEQATEIDNASIEEPVSDSDGVNEDLSIQEYCGRIKWAIKDSNGKKFLFFNEINNVAQTINKLTKPGDFILIKGSRSWRLEKIIKSID